MKIKSNDNSELIQQLFAAELQFRLAAAVELATRLKKQPLDLPSEWSYGQHSVKLNEIALRKGQADYAAWYLFHSATLLMATEIKNAVIAVIQDPINHSDLKISNAFQIARFIRNAFTHHPFNPIWSIEKKYQGKIFEVPKTIKLNTTSLNGAAFNWRHYGGPFAILKLSHYVRFEILKDSGKKPSERILPKL